MNARAALLGPAMMQKVRHAITQASARNEKSGIIIWDGSWPHPTEKGLVHLGRLSELVDKSVMDEFKKAASDATGGLCKDVTYEIAMRPVLFDTIHVWTRPRSFLDRVFGS